MIKQIAYNINDFHPTLRPVMQAEIDRIMKETPPFTGELSIHVMDKIEEKCECGNEECVSDTNDALLASFAITQTRVNQQDILMDRIIFNAKRFGVNGDIDELHNRLNAEKTIGGGLSSEPAYVLTHEYGHVMDDMLHQYFGKEDDGSCLSVEVAKNYERFVKTSKEARTGLDELFCAIGLPHTQIRSIDQLVSSYSYRSLRENFAETFAAIHWGDEWQVSRPVVSDMKALIDSTYRYIYRQGVSN